MNKLVIFILLYTVSLCASAITLERGDSESPQAFAKRLAPKDGEITHEVIETNQWKLQAPAIIAFYEHPPSPDDITEVTITGYAFIPVSSTKYEKVLIDGYGAEGGDPKIESIFFANTDKTDDKKLIVIVSWDQNHAILQGTIYETYIYSLNNSAQPKLTYLKKLSDELSGGCDCWRPKEDGPSTKAKYKTAGDIKQALKKIILKNK